MKTVQEYKIVFENLKGRPRKTTAEKKQILVELVNLKKELKQDEKVDRSFRAAALILMDDFYHDTFERFNPSEFIETFCNDIGL